MARRRFQRGCLFKKGKVWVARWWEDIIRADGAPGRVRRFATLGEIPKHAAQKALERTLQPINHGKQRPQSVMTFDRFVRERWIPAEMPLLDPVTLKLDRNGLTRSGLTMDNRPGSAVTYGSYVRSHLNAAFGQKPLNELTRWEVQTFLSGKLKQGYSGAHVHGMRTTLSKVLQAAVEWGLLESNPARGCRIGHRESVKQRTYLTAEQVQQLTGALPDPCRPIVLVAVFTGLRIGEILALRWGRVDFLRATLSVEESYSDRFGPPKTRSSKRIIPMSTSLRRVLEVHRRSCCRTEDRDLVFSTRKGTPLSSKNLRNRALEPTRKSLGLPRVSWHNFRYTHTTWLCEAGVSPRIAQSILGHSDVSMTLNVYTQVVPESQRLAMEKVAAVLDTNGHQNGPVAEPVVRPQ
ncbi:MAG: tyrosine-type recombinase/integrase [Candidatus Sulfotelmatobacter sp.]